MVRHKEKYFAAKSAEETSIILLNKANRWFDNLDSNGYLDKLKEMWAAYHGAYYNDTDDGHSISFTGEQGEFVGLAVNHLRNLGEHILRIITAQRPAMQARSVNTDYKSYVQTKLANDLLDYYMREKRLERYIKRAVELSIVMGSGFIKMEWNALAGEIKDIIEEEDPGTGEMKKFPMYEGDVIFRNLSPFDVVMDSTKEDQNHDWVLVRDFKNKFDLMEKFPELAEKILPLKTKDEHQRYRFTSIGFEQTDDIPIYEFYHKPTESMPNGRYLLFLDKEIVLMDTDLPYDNIPVYRIAPSEILGTPYGYTPLFDILPIQDAINMSYSTILTNQNAFGVQSIISPRGSNVNPNSLVGGMTLLEYNHQFGKPEALQLTQTPAEVFKFLEMLIQAAETISGVSSTSRGNPEKGVTSGNALALVQSMSIQFLSGLQQSYVELVEDIGTGLINMLKKFAHVPRIAQIAGKDNRAYIKEFSSKDLDGINRVIVDIGNPLSKTTAGRVEMADHLLQMGMIRTPEQYFQVLDVGRLEPIIGNTQHELMLIKSENEKMISGEVIKAIATERHSIHIEEHASILSDADLKNDPELNARVLAHIQEHIEMLRTVDPDLLMLRGEQPLGPVGGNPANPQDPNAMVNQSAIEADPMAAQDMQQPVQGAPGGNASAAPSSPLPAPATPPEPFGALPTDPSKVPLK